MVNRANNVERRELNRERDSHISRQERVAFFNFVFQLTLWRGTSGTPYCPIAHTNTNWAQHLRADVARVVPFFYRIRPSEVLHTLAIVQTTHFCENSASAMNDENKKIISILTKGNEQQWPNQPDGTNTKPMKKQKNRSTFGKQKCLAFVHTLNAFFCPFRPSVRPSVRSLVSVRMQFIFVLPHIDGSCMRVCVTSVPAYFVHRWWKRL